MPTLHEIAKTITGPNEVRNVGLHKLSELQDLKWGRLKAQEQAHLLRAAGFVKALFDNEREKAGPATTITAREYHSGAVSRAVPPPLPTQSQGEAVPPPHPAPTPCDQRSTQHLLQLLRAFVTRNVTHWRMGAGSNHHPIWADVAADLDQYDLNYDASSGPDWAFTMATNRTPYVELVAQYVDQQNEHEATERGG